MQSSMIIFLVVLCTVESQHPAACFHELLGHLSEILCLNGAVRLRPMLIPAHLSAINVYSDQL